MTKERSVSIRLITEDFSLHGIKGVHGMICMLSQVEEFKEQYMIVVDSGKDEFTQSTAFIHECLHIWRDDLRKENLDVNSCEYECHQEEKAVITALRKMGVQL